MDLINPAKDGRPVAVRCGWANNPDGNLIKRRRITGPFVSQQRLSVVTRAKNR